MANEIGTPPSGDVSTWPKRYLRALTALDEEDLSNALAFAAIQRAGCPPAEPFASHEDLLRFARSWEGAANKYDESDFETAQGHWREEAEFATERFLGLMPQDAGDADARMPWVRWFAEECAHSVADGRGGYADLLLETIDEEIVAIELPDGRMDVWDGWHRLAACIIKGSTIRAVVGRPPQAAAAA